jgi:hypothetical protein
LTEAYQYEAAHDQLLEQYEILETRLALAEEESDRLSQVNAELISHGNGLQKISYVEGVRREMSLIKQVSCSVHGVTLRVIAIRLADARPGVGHHETATK